MDTKQCDSSVNIPLSLKEMQPCLDFGRFCFFVFVFASWQRFWFQGRLSPLQTFAEFSKKLETKAIEDELERKNRNHEMVCLARRLLLKWVTISKRRPSHYLHLFAYHLQAYLADLEEISKDIGFPIGIKEMSQDPVEAHHR